MTKEYLKVLLICLTTTHLGSMAQAAHGQLRAAAPLNSGSEARNCLLAHGANVKEICRRAAQRSADDVDSLLDLGDALDRAGRHVDAIAVYGEGLKVNRNHKTLRRKWMLARSNHDESARQVGAARKRVSAGHDTVSLRLEETKCKRLSGASAVAACRQALQRQPDNASLHMALGKALEDVGRRDEARLAYANARTGSAGGTSVLPAQARRTAATEPPRPSEAVVTEARKSGEPVVVAQLELLDKLRGRNLISSQEYERRKRSVLDTTFVSSPRVAGVKSSEGSGLGLVAGLDVGRYHALVIGNDAYSSFETLDTAVSDASAVSAVLKDVYGFSVQTLTNATRHETVTALSRMRAALTPKDNLLVYYAGHGILDEDTARGYWLPVDAEQDSYANWISNADVTDALNGMKAKHVLVIADSCFSGSLSRSARLPTGGERRTLIERLVSKRSRNVLSSGGLEPVADAGGGGHSVFTKALLDVLQENVGVLEATRLFSELRPRVVANADQTPEYTIIRKAGHEGGDFVFIRSQ